MLAGLNVGRYRDNSVELTKFAHIGKFKKPKNEVYLSSSRNTRKI